MVEVITRNGRDDHRNAATAIRLTPAGPVYEAALDPHDIVGQSLAALKQSFAALASAIRANPIPADPKRGLERLEELGFILENLADLWSPVDRGNYRVRFVNGAGKESFDLASHPNRGYEPGQTVYLQDAGNDRKTFRCAIVGQKIDDAAKQITFPVTIIEAVADTTGIVIANEV